MSDVTVLMPVYNDVEYLRESVDSILAQTISDFEYLIIDDGSTDGSWELLQDLKDPRLKLCRNPKNLGLATTLNVGLERISTPFILRMDADDISMPRRLEWQLDFMNRHPDVGMAGTWLRTFGARGERGLHRYSEEMSQIRADMLFGSPVAHATLIFRKEMFDRHGLRYDPSYTRSEDFDLCVRAADMFAIGNLPRSTYQYRRHPGCVTRSNEDAMRAQVRDLVQRQVGMIGLSPSDAMLELHSRAMLGLRLNAMDELDLVESWFCELRDTAVGSGRYDAGCVRHAVGNAWFKLCSNSGPLGFEAMHRCGRSSLMESVHPSLRQRLQFAASVTWHSLRRDK
jgi:hypothetical protein